MLDLLVKKITSMIVDKSIKPKINEGNGYKSISVDIQTLKELQEQLLKRDEELKMSRMEWDKTFDAIIDTIVLINKDGKIIKANKSFIQCVQTQGGNWKEVIGKYWNQIRGELGISTPCIVDKCFETGVYQESNVPIGDKIYSVLTNPVLDENFEVQSVIRVSRDITKIEQQKQRLDRRGRIFEAISNMSKTLMSHHNWSVAVNEILKSLGEAVGASRTYIFTNEVKEDKICANLSEIWIGQDMVECFMTECINYNLLPAWKIDLETGHTVEGKIKECLHCTDKGKCVKLEEIEVCAVPIFADKKWWGFIGFDYNSRTKKWKEEDEAILRIAADIIGGVVYHRDKYYKCLDGKDNTTNIE